MLKIGMLTSGGDCQALNAAMRGVVKGLHENVDEVELYGFINGYHGLIYGDYRLLTGRDFSGILTKGGTILGTSRTPFKMMREPDENGLDKVEAMKHNYYKLNLDGLVILGGNGTQKTANLLREEGLNVIHLPKTIDNDIVEVMGHKVGWLTLNAGVASGADVVLIPEIPFDINKIAETIEKRNKEGKGFTIIACAEGAISKKDAKLSKKDYKKKLENYTYPSVSYEIAEQLTKKTGAEVRVVVPGHAQRGGNPDPYDRVLCTRLGAAAAMAIIDKKWGNMVAMVNRSTKLIPLEKVAGKLKEVDPNGTMIQEAKYIGISFGD